MKNKSQIILLLVAVIAFALTSFFRPPLEKQKEENRLWPTPPPHLELFSFGYSDFMADILWLRLIQDFDTCNKPSQAIYETFEERFARSETKLDSLKAEVLKRLSEAEVKPKKLCNYSWAYFMLNSITQLSPRYRIAYITGGVTLSVIVEDFMGAKLIFDRGLLNFPEDWSLSYRAAYHYLYDQQDPQRAAELLIQAADNGAPYWLRSLASRLLTLSGQAEVALAVLKDYLKTLENPLAIKDVEARIRALEDLLKSQ